MAKFCAYDGKEITEEEGSSEVREFFKFGKVCLYFCTIEEMIGWEQSRNADVLRNAIMQAEKDSLMG